MSSHKILDYRGSDARKNFGKPVAGNLYPNPRNAGGYVRPRIYSVSDTKVSVDTSTRQSMLKFSRDLFASCANLGGAVVSKNQWAFSEGWNPQFKGKNTAWGDAAEAWLRDKWYPLCNVRGSNFDFRTSLYLIGNAIDIDGDILLVLTTSKDGFPLFQLIPSHRIGQRNWSETTVSKGRYKGLAIIDGVILNNSGRPVAYRVLGDNASEDYDLSAQSSILFTEPEWSDQYRGIPRVARTVMDWMDTQDIDYFLKRAVKLDSSQGILHHTNTGEPDSGANVLGDEESPNTGLAAQSQGLAIEQLNGGEIYYLQAGSGEKIEPFRTERPHSNVENFIGRIERRGLYAVGWPIELLDPSKIGGASVRLIQDLARKSIRTRQNTGEKAAKLAVAYAISKAMDLGYLPDNRDDEWWNFNFTRPAAISVDGGNEASADREAVKMGLGTLSEVAAKKGMDWTELRNQSQREAEDLLDRATELSKKYNISLDSALNLLSQRNPNVPALTQVDNTTPNKA